MKNNLRIFSTLIFCFFAFSLTTFGQEGECDTDGCPFGSGTQRPATTVTSTSAVFAPIATNILPGDYSVCAVTSGTTYEWSLCPADGGVAAYDAQMTLFTDADVELCYSDDICGLNPKIRYVATFTGTVKVQINVYDCITAGGGASTLVWRAIDPNFSDVAVTEVYTLSKKMIPNGNPHAVFAAIKNNGAQAVPFLELSLAVTGANTFTADGVVSNLGPNETQIVEFEAFSSANSGTNSIAVRVLDTDDVPANNVKTVTQNANATSFAYTVGTTPATGLGFNGAANGEIGVRFKNNGDFSIAQANVFFNAAGAAHRIKIYDATGPGGLPGAQLFFSAANRTATAGLNQIAISPAVPVSGDFWVVVVQQTTTFANVGCETESPLRPGTFFFKAGAAGSAWTDVSTLPTLPYRLMFEVVAACSPPSAPAAITGPATVCQGTPSTYSVTAVSGATGYQWVVPTGWTGTSTTTSITVTPGANGGNLGVRASSACGPSSPTILAVAVTPAPAAAFSYSAATFCTTAENPTPTSATPGVYRATPAGLVFADSTTGQINIAASTPGNYVVSLTVTDGATQCTRTVTQNVAVQVCSNIVSGNKLSGVRAYPVPATSEIFISSEAEELKSAKVVLHALDGRMVVADVVSTQANLMSINVGQIPRGLYKLKLVLGGKIWTSNIVLE